MRIMASHSANTVCSIKLHNGGHKQAGIDTLKEIYRVHLPGSDTEKVTWQRQGQPNWGHIAHYPQRGLGTVQKGHCSV
jgi:hypothetical protein